MITGCSIAVVYMLWEHEVRVRLPAARQCYDEAYAKVDTMLGEAALQDGSIDQICG